MPQFPQTTPYKSTPVAGDRIMGLDSENNNAMTEFPFNTSTSVVDVTTFGATGDGVTDDTANIQLSIDYAETLCSVDNIVTVKFPNAIYKTTYTLLYGSYLVFDFDGSMIDLYCETNDGSVFAARSFYDDYYASNGAVERVLFKNGSIRGNNNKGNGFGLCRVSNVVCDNLFTDQIDNHLIDISGGNNVTIMNCRAYDLTTAAYQIDNLESGNGTAFYIETSAHQSVSITMDNVRSYNIRVINNFAQNCYHAVHLHRDNGSSTNSNIIISGNVFTNCTYPIYNDQNKYWRNVTISGNIFYSDEADTRCLLIDGKMRNLTVTGNVFYGYEQVFLQNVSGGECTNFVFTSNRCYAIPSGNEVRALNLKRTITNALISNNQFYGFERAVACASTTVGINIDVFNNQFIDLTERAVDLQQVTGFSIKGNTFYNINTAFDATATQWGSPTETGIDQTNYKIYTSVTGNGGIVIFTSSDGDITGNRFYNVKGACIGFNDDGWSNISIIDNKATNCFALVCTESTSDPKPTDLQISGNHTKTNDKTAYPMYAGLYLTDSSGVYIKGNIIKNVMHNAVDLAGSDNIVATDNFIEGGFTYGADHKAFSLFGVDKMFARNNQVNGTYEKYWGILSYTDIPSDGDTVTIGGTVYTFLEAASSPNEVPIDVTGDMTYDNLVLAINGEDALGTVANAFVTAERVGSTVEVKAIKDRYVNIATIGSLTNASWAAATLQKGNNYSYYFNEVTNFEGYVDKYLGWDTSGSGVSGSSNVKVYFTSNTSPNTEGGIINHKYAVGSIITNDNNTGGSPQGEPMHWVCTSEADPSVWSREGQISYRTTAGNPVSNNVTPVTNYETIWDTTNNRWFKAGQDDPTASPADTDWQQISNYSTEGTGSPSGVVTPRAKGQEYLDTAVPRWYKSTGTTNTDWVALN